MRPPLNLPLHIIEPTLVGTAGHCHSLVQALAAAAPECDTTVWAGQRAAGLWTGPGRLLPYFSRRWRRLQTGWLLRRLMGQPGRILVTTAGSTDLLLAGWAAAGTIAPRKLFLFVHWLGNKPAKARWLSAMARRQPHIEILAPSTAVADFFSACGFNSTVVPYPVQADPAANTQSDTESGTDIGTGTDTGTGTDYSTGTGIAAAPAFRHLLAAGGARLDKGFDRVVDLVVEMQRLGLRWPITVQTSLESRQRLDPALVQQMARLRNCGYAGLRLCDSALTPQDYRALFAGAIAIQPYRADDFKDRVSGVTLDALGAGAPVIVTAGTWMARLVQRFGAGVATDDLSPSGLLRAVQQVMADPAGHASRARLAAATVQGEHSARRFMDVVLDRT